MGCAMPVLSGGLSRTSVIGKASSFVRAVNHEGIDPTNHQQPDEGSPLDPRSASDPRMWLAESRLRERRAVGRGVVMPRGLE